MGGNVLVMVVLCVDTILCGLSCAVAFGMGDLGIEVVLSWKMSYDGTFGGPRITEQSGSAMLSTDVGGLAISVVDDVLWRALH
eukprot:5408286-Ditylum_brightwellii.AAC.1